MIRKLQFAALVSVVVLAALPMAAQSRRVYLEGNSWVEEISGSMPAARVLRVSTKAGSIQVRGGDQRDIRYTIKKRVYVPSEIDARRDLPSLRITTSQRGDTAAIEANWERPAPRRFTAEFMIQVPRDLGLVRLNTEGGTIEVEHIAGQVEAGSGGGSMRLSDITGPVVAETRGGNVEVSRIPRQLTLRTGGGAITIRGESGRISAETGGGSIIVGSSQGATLLETGGGSIQIKSCDSTLRASTAGGSIEVGQVDGAAVLETGGGSIRLRGAKGHVTATTGAGAIELFSLMQGARAETGAGSIIAEFLGSAMKDSLLESSLGDIVIFLAPEARLTVQATVRMAHGHRIQSEFSGLNFTSEGPDWGPRSLYAEGALNGGGSLLKVVTMSGNIEIRRRSR